MRRFLLLLILALGVGALVLALHDVPTTATAEDAAAVAKIVERATPPSAQRSFAEEIATIRAIQDAVLTVAPLNEGIPLGQPREPADLLAAKKGLCFDRSRAIEKALTLAGIENRHAYVYESEGGLQNLIALAKPEVTSHAVTEALTSKGWIVIDSNVRWIGLTVSDDAISLEELEREPGLAGRAWDSGNRAPIASIFTRDFAYVFGLYSRHGRFYPPYTPVPDIDAGQIVHNFTD